MVGGVRAVELWAAERVVNAEVQFNASNRSRYPSPLAWSDHVVYQVMPDRFANGDPSNDRANLNRDQTERMDTSHLGGMEGWRHGGDLRGLIGRQTNASTPPPLLLPTRLCRDSPASPCQQMPLTPRSSPCQLAFGRQPSLPSARLPYFLGWTTSPTLGLMWCTSTLSLEAQVLTMGIVPQTSLR